MNIQHEFIASAREPEVKFTLSIGTVVVTGLTAFIVGFASGLLSQNILSWASSLSSL